MDPSAIAPTREAKDKFQKCWPDLDKLYAWHKQYTSWLSEELIREYVDQYARIIEEQKNQSQKIETQDSSNQKSQSFRIITE